MVSGTGARSRGARVALVVGLAGVAVLDAGLRAGGLLSRTTALNTSQFDEGVYASAAASLTRGDLPYRDYVFLHPPGVALVLAPVAAVTHAVASWSAYLVLSRWLIVAVAAANVVLLLLVAHRWKGWIAAAVAGVLYAGYLPAVRTEEHVMLEPLVSLALLACALAWLGASDDDRSDRRAVLGGVLAGVTTLVKLTGGVAIVAVLAAGRLRAAWRQRTLAFGAAIATGVVVLVPFVVAAGPSAVFDQVVLTQLRRPGKDISGGTIVGLSDRLDHLGSYGPFALNRLGDAAGLVGAALAAVAVVWAWRAGGATGRFFAAATVASAAAILFSPDYYDQYPVTTFAGIAVLLGGGAASLVAGMRARDRRLRDIALAAIALCLMAGLGDTAVSVREDDRHLEHSDPAATIAGIVGTECISADVPEVLLMLDRLPPVDGSGDRLVDPFGALVHDAIRDDDHPTTQAALDSRPAQSRLRQALRACPYAVTRGEIDPLPPRWSTSTRTWFLARFERAATNDAGIVLWRRTAQP